MRPRKERCFIRVDLKIYAVERVGTRTDSALCRSGVLSCGLVELPRRAGPDMGVRRAVGGRVSGEGPGVREESGTRMRRRIMQHSSRQRQPLSAGFYQQLAAVVALVVALIFIVVRVRAGFAANNVTLDWSIFTKPSQLTSGTYLTTILIGMLLTIRLAVIGIVLAMILGTIVGVSRLSANPVVSRVAAVYVEFFRNTPLLVQIFFWNFGIINALPQSIKSWLNSHSPEQWAVLAALSVYTSSYIAETIRAGILSVPKGQSEAAQSLGLSGSDVLVKIILPQAFRTVLPPLGSQFLNLTKNSSLASQIGVAELFYYGTQVQSYTFRGFESITAITLAYLLLSLSITFLLNLLSRKLALPGRAGVV